MDGAISMAGPLAIWIVTFECSPLRFHVEARNAADACEKARLKAYKTQETRVGPVVTCSPENQ